jgi:hypothetical protein
MLQGYELWLVDRDGRRAFRPAAARCVSDVIAEVRELLAADPAVREVAIELAGQPLMTLETTAPAGMTA